MAPKTKPLNPLRKSMRLRGQATAAEQDAVASTEEVETSEEETNGFQEDSAADQLIQEMNNAAGKSSEGVAGSVGSSGRGIRKCGRTGQTNLDDESPSNPQTPSSKSRAEAIRVEVPLRGSQGGLKKAPPRPQSAANFLQRDIFKVPVEESSASDRPRKIRRLNQPKVSNPSPLRKHGVIDLTGTRGVDLEDASTTRQAKKPRRACTRSHSDDDFAPEPEPEPEPEPANKDLQHDADKVDAMSPESQRSQADADSDYLEDEVEIAPQEPRELPDEAEQEEKAEEERVRRKCCEGTEPHIEVFGCAEDWRNLFVAGHRLKMGVRRYVYDKPSNTKSTSTKYNPRTEVGKRVADALDEVLMLYRTEGTDWSAAAAAVTAAKKATTLIKDDEDASNRGLDLYLSVLPRFVPILKAILVRLQPTAVSVGEELRPLTRMLEYARQTLERAQQWTPSSRPTTELAGYKILAVARHEYATSVKQIQAAYKRHLDSIRLDEETKRAELIHKKRVERQKEMDRLQREEKQRRIQAVRDATEQRLRALEEADRAREECKEKERAKREAARKRWKQQQRGPLNEITREIVGPIHDIDDFPDDGPGDAIYQDPQETKDATQQKQWTTAENGALLGALQRQYEAENRFSMIYKRHGDRMPGRSIDDIRHQATVLKHNMMDLIETLTPDEAKYWNWLLTVPG